MTLFKSCPDFQILIWIWNSVEQSSTLLQVIRNSRRLVNSDNKQMSRLNKLFLVKNKIWTNFLISFCREYQSISWKIWLHKHIFDLKIFYLLAPGRIEKTLVAIAIQSFLQSRERNVLIEVLFLAAAQLLGKGHTAQSALKNPTPCNFRGHLHNWSRLTAFSQAKRDTLNHMRRNSDDSSLHLRGRRLYAPLYFIINFTIWQNLHVMSQRLLPNSFLASTKWIPYFYCICQSFPVMNTN